MVPGLDAIGPCRRAVTCARTTWRSDPRAKRHIAFADSHIFAFRVTGELLNAGFGKAYKLAAQDLEQR